MIWKLGILAVVGLHLMVSTTADPVVQPAIEQFTPILTQKMIFDLLWHVDQPEKVHPELYERALAWNWNADTSLYKDPNVVQEFLKVWKSAKLERGQLFSVFEDYHKHILIEYFKVLYTAKDLSTFFSIAAWGRVYMNEGLFVTAFYTAVLRRPDTRNFVLPPTTDLKPWEFFDAEIMQEVYDTKMSYDPHNLTNEPILIFGNYSDWYDTDTRDPETKLAYFREDIGMGSLFEFMFYEYPGWLPSIEYGMIPDLRAQLYYWFMKMPYNMYHMHRLSHGLPEVEPIKWSGPIATGYKPTLAHRNGLRYPERKEWSEFPSHMNDMLEKVQQYEDRINEAIGSEQFVWPVGTSIDEQKSIYTQKGFNMLINIITGNADSINKDYYGSFVSLARKLFGFSPEPITPYKIRPSALEKYSTGVRDPAWFRIARKMLYMIQSFINKLPSYTYEELHSPGIKIQSATVDKLITSFAPHDTFVSNAFKVHSHEDAEAWNVRVRQNRLNHHPFSFHLAVESSKSTTAILRIFLGPKINSYGKDLPIEKAYSYFYEINTSLLNLEAGLNKFKLDSDNLTFGNLDYESSDSFYKKISESLQSHVDLPVYENKSPSFIGNLMLPMGRPEGFPVQFFFFISEFVEEVTERPHSYVMGYAPYDKKPVGYPLDRPIHRHNFTVPNMYFKTSYIYHEGPTDPNWGA